MPIFARALALAFSLLLAAPLFAAAQDDTYTTLVRAQSIEKLRRTAREGDFVTVQGRVIRVYRTGNLFEIEDDTGKIVVRIPDYVTRDGGRPARNESVRVSGQYDHKTFVDQRNVKHTSDGADWGIRVRQLDREISVSGRNPTPDPAHAMEQKPRQAAAPAAIGSTVTPPKLDAELKARMGAAADRVRAANRETSEAEAAYARGLHLRPGDDEMAYLENELRRNEQAQSEARAEIPPLVREARENGIDEKLIEMYLSGLSK